MMRFVLLVLLSCALLLGARDTRAAALSVVTTTPDLAAVASAIGGDRVQVRSLSAPSEDPHWVDPKPSLALALSNADLLVAIGAELEAGWLPTLQVGSRNAKIQKGSRGYLECAELVALLEVPPGKVDRSQGDLHASGNPHYMLDPRAIERVAVGLGKRLAELDPSGRAVYLERTKQLVARLRAARARWEERLAPLRGQPVITYHRSLVYLADWLGLVIVDRLEPKPGVAPSPSHVAAVIRRAQERKVRLLVQERHHPTNTAELVAKKTGAKLVRIPSAVRFPSQDIVAFLDEIVNALAGPR
ncbi:MAG: zinc ABC transporter substrate-binding protein [Pseudomonadota bacterium]|nr:MAG: ABC transporter substrate-binding protein [Pseudomonadota bacterium]